MLIQADSLSLVEMLNQYLQTILETQFHVPEVLINGMSQVCECN